MYGVSSPSSFTYSCSGTDRSCPHPDVPRITLRRTRAGHP
ncbi:hypothetical protein SBD_4534 [Streptomyces bottropensis ATCC 25435]|uniref:Uncharacterized protein n=1 Tax=Streptomyces bottropensis ATCC 25435 TaxID=1054862 RepID=M3EF53_9ACTN|nr:hypothetical protein SBD_4534 [Streptomyces bottropensis ATCC 25435]